MRILQTLQSCAKCCYENSFRLNRMATARDRTDIGLAVTAALGRLEDGMIQCQNQEEWEAIRQQMEEINKEVQSLLVFYTHDDFNQHCRCCVYQFEDESCESPPYKRIACNTLTQTQINQSLPHKHHSDHILQKPDSHKTPAGKESLIETYGQVTAKEDSVSVFIKPAPDQISGILPFFKMGSEKIQQLKPKVYKAVAKCVKPSSSKSVSLLSDLESVPSVNKHYTLELQGVKSVEVHEVCMVVDHDICETNFLQFSGPAVKTCGSLMKDITDLCPGQTKPTVSQAGGSTEVSDIAKDSCPSETPVVICYGMFKQVVDDDSITIDSLDESQLLSKSKSHADITEHTTTDSRSSVDVKLVLTTDELMQHEALSDMANFSFVNESRMLTKSTVQGIINMLGADINSETCLSSETSGEKAIARQRHDNSFVGANISINESKYLLETTGSEISLHDMTVSDTLSFEDMSNEDESVDNDTHEDADINIMVQRNIFDSPMNCVINTLGVISNHDTIAEMNLNSEINICKDESNDKQSISRHPSDKKSTTSVLDLTADFSFMEHSRMLSKSTIDRIINTLEVDVDSRNITQVETDHSVEISDKSNQNTCGDNGAHTGHTEGEVSASDGRVVTAAGGVSSDLDSVIVKSTSDHGSSSSGVYKNQMNNQKKEKEKTLRNKNKHIKKNIVKLVDNKKVKEKSVISKQCKNSSCKTPKTAQSKEAVNIRITENPKQKLTQTSHLASKKTSSSEVQQIHKRSVENKSQYSESVPSAKKSKKLRHSVDVLLKKIGSRRLLQKSVKTLDIDTKQVHSQTSWFTKNPFRGLFKKKPEPVKPQNSCMQPAFNCVGGQTIRGDGEMRNDFVCPLIIVPKLHQSLVQEYVSSEIHVNDSPCKQPASRMECPCSDVHCSEVPIQTIFHYTPSADCSHAPKPVNRSLLSDYILSEAPPPSVSSLSPVCDLVTKSFSKPMINILPIAEAATIVVPQSTPSLSPLMSFYCRSGMPLPLASSPSYHQNKFISSTVLPMYEPLMEEDTLFNTAVELGSDETYLYPLSDSCPVFGYLPDPGWSAHSDVGSPNLSSLCEPLSLLAVSPLSDQHLTFSQSVTFIHQPLALSQQPMTSSPHPLTFSTKYLNLSSQPLHSLSQPPTYPPPLHFSSPPLLSPVSEPFSCHFPYGTPSPPYLSPVHQLNNKNKTIPSSRLSQFVPKRNLSSEVEENSISPVEDMDTSQHLTKPLNQQHRTSTLSIKTSSVSPSKKMKYSVLDSHVENCVTGWKENHFTAPHANLDRNLELLASAAVARNPVSNMKISSVSIHKKQNYAKPSAPLKDYMERFVTSPEKSLLLPATNFDMTLLEELSSLSGLKESETLEVTNCDLPKIKPDQNLDMSKTKKQKSHCGDKRLPIKKRYMKSVYQHGHQVLPSEAKKSPITDAHSRRTKQKQYRLKHKQKYPPTTATMINICKHLNTFMDIPAKSVFISCRRSHKSYLLDLAKMCYIQVHETDLCIELKKTCDSRRPTAIDLEWLWV